MTDGKPEPLIGAESDASAPLPASDSETRSITPPAATDQPLAESSPSPGTKPLHETGVDWTLEDLPEGASNSSGVGPRSKSHAIEFETSAGAMPEEETTSPADRAAGSTRAGIVGPHQAATPEGGGAPVIPAAANARATLTPRPAQFPPIPPPRRTAGPTERERQADGSSALISGVVLAMLLIALVAAVVLWNRTTVPSIPKPAEVRREVVAPVDCSVVIDALPWARIEEILDTKGTNYLTTPEYTPMFTELPAGDYTIRFAVGEEKREMRLTAHVEPGKVTTIRGDFGRIDTREYFRKSGW